MFQSGDKLFLSDKEYEYNTETEDVVKQLKGIAEDELYYESISAEYSALIAKLEKSASMGLITS